jgi:hypothetical protein
MTSRKELLCADDLCKDCGLARREHHCNGSAYGVCGQFSEVSHGTAPASREEIARVIDPGAWEVKDRGFTLASKVGIERSLAKADAILALQYVAQAPSREPTASQLIAWFKSRAGISWEATVRDIERAVSELASK